MPLKTIAHIKYSVCLITLLYGCGVAMAQHTNIVRAILNDQTKEIDIQQEFIYVNNSKDTLNFIYFNDWANSYSSKNTPLAKRLEEEFKKSLHLAKDHDRGCTNIISVVDDDYIGMQWKRTPEKDIVRLKLNQPLKPNQSVRIFITYVVKLPPNKYTDYGYTSNHSYYLKDWYLSPAVFYKGEWLLYSNKDLEDIYTDIANTTIKFSTKKGLYLTANSNKISNVSLPNNLQEIVFNTTNGKNCEIIITPEKHFTTHITKSLTVKTDIVSSKYDKILQEISIDKVADFIREHLGEYRHKELLVSTIDYNKNPLYGINQLPYFIRPYEERFQFEMKFLKTALNSFIKETIYLNPRKDKWVADALVNYLMILYVDKYYPDQRLLGKLSKIFGIRSYHLAKIKFNGQYALLSMLMVRKNIDQPLSTQNDSLLKFNQKISNRYKAGLGLAYLSSYIGKEVVDKSIKTFCDNANLRPTSASNFKSILKAATKKDISWFFNEYVSSSKRIDFKIKKVVKKKDSLVVTLKNKTAINVPISMFGLKNDSVVSAYWFPNIIKEKTYTIPRNGEDKLVLNYDKKILEFNQRNNWKSLGGFFSKNKKFKFQFLKDIENPYYTEVFYAPTTSFNAYDGVSLGMRFANKTLLKKPFVFGVNPLYSFNEKDFIGSGKLTYTKFHAKSGFYISNYSLSASTFHFQKNSRYTTITPSVSFGWRPDDLISNKRKFLSIRYVNVFRTFDKSLTVLETDPDYNVLNVRYIDSNNGVINHFSWYADAQQSNDFTKLSFNLEYRKLFDNNMQFNIRVFAGKFLRNRTTAINFFSFALDRPTDYLFDHSFLGRSEGSGIYSQQIIIAEGGFKSKLENPFANNWMATVNTSVNIWRWVEFYSDFGFLKNKKERFVYDSGIRLNMVTDYFELYFPLYSNNGWEVSQPHYNEKIRFVVTLSPKTLLQLFKRKWF